MRWALCVVGLIVHVPIVASAHVFEHPKTLRLGVSTTEVLVSVTYDVNPGNDAHTLRSLFDRDANQEIDDEENAMLEAYLEKTATMWLELFIDNEKVPLVLRYKEAHRTRRPVESSETLGITLLYRVDLELDRVLQIELRDRDKDKTKHVPVVVDVAPGVQPEFSSQGEWQPKLRQIQRIRLHKGASVVLRLRPGAS